MECVERPDFLEILERNRVIIAQKLQVDRSFLFDYLREKGVFDSEDCEDVQSEKTRERRVGKFLDVLSLKGQDAYNHFIDAVQQLSPSLYEALTGQKAGFSPNRAKGSSILGGNGSLDLDIITSHLKRTMQDLQEMTLRYDQVLKENGELTKNLKEAALEVEWKQKRVEELERQRENADKLMLKTQGKVQRAEQGSAHQVNSLNRDLCERNTYIIALQMKLLASQESIENFRAKLAEVTTCRDHLSAKLTSIAVDYANQRRESIKLSEELATQKGDIEKAAGMKLRVREMQFATQKLLAERDEAQKELNQLKEWTEALKARYDIVEEERKQTQHSHENVVADCSELRDQINELEIRLMIARREIEDLGKRNTDLEQSAATFREQRDFYAGARKDAVEERDQARREQDEALKRHNEALSARDHVISQQMEHAERLETRHEALRKELQTSREKLAATELEVEKIKRVEVDRGAANVGESRPFGQASLPNLHLETVPRPQTKDAAPNLSPSSSSQSSEESFDWKSHRRTKEIIDSLKKRVGRTTSPSSSSSETSETPLSSSLSLDEKLEELMPQIKSLSPGAQMSVSLERNKISHIKSFDTLACMFQGTVASCNPTMPSDAAEQDAYGCFESGAFERPVGESRHAIIDRRKPANKSPKSAPVKPPFSKSASAPGMTMMSCEETSGKQGNCSGPVERDADAKDAGVRDCAESAGEDVGHRSDDLGRGNANRASLKDVRNRPAYALASNVSSIDFEATHTDGDWTVEEALQSPSLKSGPFRQRSGAKKFRDSDRPRSASAPTSPSASDSSSDVFPTVNGRADIDEQT